MQDKESNQPVFSGHAQTFIGVCYQGQRLKHEVLREPCFTVD